MMMNIFNIFDPSTSHTFSWNWLSTPIIFIILPYHYWITPSRYILIYLILINFILLEFKSIIKHSLSNTILFTSMFFFIFFNNFLGLFPYIFTSSSHMSFCMSLSLTLWLSTMTFGWMNFTNQMFSHLTPSNTPFMLMPFMVIIEFISLIIRPITLSIRLTANMIAGHILFSLLGSSIANMYNIFNFNLLIMIQIILYFLEIFVSFIQAYVFSILSVLYSSEI